MTGKQVLMLERVDESSLVRLAGELASRLQLPLVIYLQGPLGAGKTTFARALIQALGHAGKVKSPTYSLMEVYTPGKATVVHLDLYRINDPAELEFLGLDEYSGPHLLLVEWPEHGTGGLPAADLRIELQGGGGHRRLILTAQNEKAQALMESVAWDDYRT